MSTIVKVKYEVRGLEPDDIFLIPLREQERQAWEGRDLAEVATSKLGYPSWTMLADGMPLVSYGILLVWPSLGGLWSWFSTDAERHRWALWKHLRWHWRAVLEDFPQLKRLETWTLKDDRLAERVVQHLGFVRVAVKPWFGPQGATYWEWVWYPGERTTYGH